MNTLTLDHAVFLAEAGYAVHWLRPRSKAPLQEGWSTAPVATPDTLRATYRPGYNLGIRCGAWSQPVPGHGLAVLDVDIRDPQYQDDVTEAVAVLLPESLAVPVVLSGRGMGSRHLWAACPLDALPPKANVTIAHGPPPADKTWKLEVLSTGKHVVCPPSVHPDTGRRYEWAFPERMPFLPPVWSDALRAAVQAALDAKATRHIHDGLVAHGPRERAGDRPGDAYNRAADWRTILEPHGWVPVRHRGDITDWRRPGKEHGISATTNYAGSGLLYVFSSNALPFEPDTAYSPFAAYALLEYGGDFPAAARQVLRDPGLPIGPVRPRPQRDIPALWYTPAPAAVPPIPMIDVQEVPAWTI